MRNFFKRNILRSRFNHQYGPGIRPYIVASLLVFFSCCGVVYWSWHSSQSSAQRNQETGRAYALNTVQEAVMTRLTSYEEILHGAVGLFQANDGLVSREAWSKYVGNFRIDSAYPGLRSLSYAQLVKPEDLPQFIADQQASDQQNFSLHPTGERPDYTPLIYIEPYAPDKAAYIGLDFNSEPHRRLASEQARDTADISLTGPITSLQDSTNKAIGFIMYAPVYKPGLPTSTIDERRQAIQGYVMAAIRANELFEGLFPQVRSTDYALQFYDGTQETTENLIYQSATTTKVSKQKGTLTASKTTQLHGRTWKINVLIGAPLLNSGQRTEPRVVLLGGLAFSALLSGLLLLLMVSRARSIAYEKHKEVQDVKDELLSLASHQLRTPATSVKQFVGMVLEGFAGDVSSEQRRLLDKAYRSNERQLEIINQILYVTRADAGRILLNKERIELNVLLKSVISEQSPSIKNRKQRVRYTSSAPKIYVNADKQYLCMAFDNLLNNASKYSHPRKSIDITVTRHRDTVSIAVTDQGVGISPNDHKKLFQKFSRIDNELSVEAGGSGIGLYLCREIIRLHGGEIKVESDTARGATFTITLPRK